MTDRTDIEARSRLSLAITIALAYATYRPRKKRLWDKFLDLDWLP